MAGTRAIESMQRIDDIPPWSLFWKGRPFFQDSIKPVALATQMF